jgi:hypothetical protein
MTPDQFSKRFTILAKNLGESIDETVRKVALAIDRDVVMSTPVDTGRARGNWIVTLNSPASGYNWNRFGADVAIAQAGQVIAGYKSGDTIYITNNLPYIIPLNRGHSKRQQPQAFYVQRAVLRQVQRIPELRILKR